MGPWGLAMPALVTEEQAGMGASSRMRENGDLGRGDARTAGGNRSARWRRRSVARASVVGSLAQAGPGGRETDRGICTGFAEGRGRDLRNMLKATVRGAVGSSLTGPENVGRVIPGDGHRGRRADKKTDGVAGND